MKFRFIVASSMLAFSGGAFASTNSSFMWQNTAQQGSVQLGIGNYTLAQKLDTSTNLGTKLNMSGNFEYLTGEYGINDMISVGLSLGAAQMKDSFTGNVFLPASQGFSGFADAVLFEKTKMELGSGTLKYGAQLGIPTSKHTYDMSYNQNFTSGGMWLQPFVGFEKTVGPGTAGTRLTYSLMVTKQDVHHEKDVFGTPEFDEKRSGGAATQVDAFYEWAFTPSLQLAGDLYYNSTATTKRSNNVSGKETDDTNGTSGFGANIYGVWLASNSPLIAIVPWLSYGSCGPGWTSNVQTSTQTTIALYGRYFF
jgi:hypothetical protein